VPDAKTALKIADDVGIDRGEMLALMAAAEETKKAATLESVAANSAESLVARGGIEPPTQGFSIRSSISFIQRRMNTMSRRYAH
jgi:sulfate adenylyltransferase subunit 1 (EFTu-like GTPase family)